MKNRRRQLIIDVLDKLEEEIDNGTEIFFEERPKLAGDKPRPNLREARMEHEARMKALSSRLDELMKQGGLC